MQHSPDATRLQRRAIMAGVVAAHLLLAWLLMSMAPQRLRPPEADSEATPIYARIIDQPRPEPLGTPAPVMLTLVPLTHPKLPTPAPQLVEIETLDSAAPGPDPAPSSAQLVTRPGPANGGGQGYPSSLGGQGLRLVRRVPPTYPTASLQRGEAGVVQMLVRVDELGRVTEVKLFRSSGFPLLDGAAIRAVGRWRFEPLMQNGRAASAWAQVNLRMGTYQQKYCRIREESASGPSGDEVHDGPGAAGYLGNEAGLESLLRELESGSPDAPAPLVALVRNWGLLESVHYVNDPGFQGWVDREILPAYQSGHPGGSVLVRWDMYVVQHQRRTSTWDVAMDSAGEIWCVHVGPGPTPR